MRDGTRLARKRSRKALPLLCATCAALAACDGELNLDGDDDDDMQPPGAFDPLAIYASANGAANAGEVDRFDEDLDRLQTFTAGNNQGIDVDVSGHLYQSGDTAGPPGSIRVIQSIRIRGNGSFDGRRDRVIPAPGSMSLKGFDIAHRAGFLIAADSTGTSLQVYGTSAGGNAVPFATTTLSGNPWDVAYDEPNDRLFVAVTDGTVLVIDDYVGGGFALGTTRIVSPAGAMNLHGIAYDAQADRLVVSDVGAPMNASDGRILVIGNASTASGAVTPSRTIEGPSTMLGDPVDVLLSGSDLYVAEKANDLILAWSGVFTGDSGDVPPDLSVAATDAESLASQPAETAVRPDVSDIDDPDIGIVSVAATSNPAVDTDDADIGRFNAEIDAGLAAFDSTVRLENITFDQSGDAFVTFDDGTDQDGGIYVLNRLAVARNGESPVPSRDRFISGDETGLVAPKGIEAVDALGLLLVADANPVTPAIRAFSSAATGNIEPIFVTGLTVPPWDLDYDPDEDRLFVALTDGTVAVFDDYAEDPEGRVPDRLIAPVSGAGVPVFPPTNLHGIVHVADGDFLIVSDVGGGTIATDGRIYVIPDASTSDGATAIVASIDDGNVLLPGNTMLGNPVDIAFDGENLYVAEKAQNMILRFDDILTSAGGNVAPTAMLNFAAAESVALAPDYLARTP